MAIVRSSAVARLRARRMAIKPGSCCDTCSCGCVGSNCCPDCAYSGPLTMAGLGDAAPADPTLQAAVDAAKGYIESGVTAALIYHGYRRTGSILWALLYGLAGKEVPAVALPIAIAQGFGVRKPCPAP